MAADLTLFGGAGTVIAAALSGIEVFKKSDAQTRDFAKRFAQALDREIAESGLKGDRLIHVFQMLEAYAPSDGEVAAADKDAGRIVDGVLKRIAEDKTCGPEHRTREALEDFKRVITPALATALEPANLAEAVETEALKRQSAQDAKLDRLLAMAEEQGASDRLRSVGITESAILGLVRNSANATEDLDQAWKELQHLVSIALKVQAEARGGSNHGDLVSEVLKRSAAHSAQGDNKAALGEIEEALAAQEAQAVRLLDSGVEYALLDGDTARAADLLVRKADLEASGLAGFAELRILRNGYFENGHAQGLNLESRLAIDLARRALARASTPEERRAAGNDLGMALSSLGERESGTELHAEAARVYRQALDGLDRGQAPRHWATLQMNLAATLQSLGSRAGDAEQLKMAIATHRSVFKECTPQNDPQLWAKTQMNLGTALKTLANIEGGKERLEEAVSAYRSALEIWTREKNALGWARVQLNLGTALKSLGDLKVDVSLYAEAQNAYRLALEELTRDRVPLEWAIVQGNLANIDIAMFDITGDSTLLKQGQANLDAAQEVFMGAGATQYVEMAERIAADISRRR